MDECKPLVGGTVAVYKGEIHNPIVYLILLGGYYTTAARCLGWEKVDPRAVLLTARGKGVVAAAYVGLAVALGALMQANRLRLRGPRGEAGAYTRPLFSST